METLWFILVAAMLTGYVVLDGFDLGAGALHAHTCENGCASIREWTDFGLSGGGGVFYFLNETFGVRGDARYFSTVGRDNGIGFWRIAFGGTFLWSAD